MTQTSPDENAHHARRQVRVADPRWTVAVRRIGTEQIEVVLNWFEELRMRVPLLK